MTFDLAVFTQFGLVGVVLAWFMFRMEKILDSHTKTINDLTKTLLLEVLSREQLSDHLRAEANEVLQRVTARTAKAMSLSPHI